MISLMRYNAIQFNALYQIRLVALCKTAATPLLMHWSYHSFSLCHWHVYVSAVNPDTSGAHPMNDFFSVVNQIRWKFHSALIQVILKWPLWSFAQDMTAVLSWHVQYLGSDMIPYNGVTLTHWGRDKIDAILQTTFSNAISRMKVLEFLLRFHWLWLLSVQLTTFKDWFR